SYIKDMEFLEEDFSDLDDLDLEEIKDMKDAIAKVQEQETSSKQDSASNEILEEKVLVDEELEYLEQKESMIRDFSDIEDIDFEELKDMKEAIESVKFEDNKSDSEISSDSISSGGISEDLEERIKQELLKKKKKKKEDIITPEKFLSYIKNKREKIWYHALYYLVFEVEDYTASKELLYDVLKEVTSKSAIDPIPEHQFYFGLGYILRLILNDKKLIRYLRGGKFKINVNVDTLKELLELAGTPISTRPVIEEAEKKKMFKDFLKDDFSDI
ncbi:MAG: hypothetical protein ACFFAO_06240, partial [Candidatus Hermodarchaeota archaeon]